MWGMGERTAAYHGADGEVIKKINALLTAHRPSKCQSCMLPLGLAASWSIILTPDNQALISGSCPECAFLPRAVVPEATD